MAQIRNPDYLEPVHRAVDAVMENHGGSAFLAALFPPLRGVISQR